MKWEPIQRTSGDKFFLTFLEDILWFVYSSFFCSVLFSSVPGLYVFLYFSFSFAFLSLGKRESMFSCASFLVEMKPIPSTPKTMHTPPSIWLLNVVWASEWVSKSLKSSISCWMLCLRRIWYTTDIRCTYVCDNTSWMVRAMRGWWFISIYE